MKQFKLEEAVAAGAALLDRKMPGWRDNIDVSRLSMSETNSCLLGQLFPRYQDALIDLFELPTSDLEQSAGDTLDEKTVEHAFDRYEQAWTWEMLNNEWKRVIALAPAT